MFMNKHVLLSCLWLFHTSIKTMEGSFSYKTNDLFAQNVQKFIRGLSDKSQSASFKEDEKIELEKLIIESHARSDSESFTLLVQFAHAHPAAQSLLVQYNIHNLRENSLMKK